MRRPLQLLGSSYVGQVALHFLRRLQADYTWTHHPQLLLRHVHAGTGAGVLSALGNALPSAPDSLEIVFTKRGVTVEQRQALRSEPLGTSTDMLPFLRVHVLFLDSSFTLCTDACHSAHHATECSGVSLLLQAAFTTGEVAACPSRRRSSGGGTEAPAHAAAASHLRSSLRCS